MNLFIKERAIQQTLKPFLSLLAHASERDIERLAILAEHLTFGEADKAIMRVIRRQISENSAGAQLIRRAFQEISRRARTRMITNLMLNSPWGVAEARRGVFFNEEGFWPPYTILISPTMQCNLQCKGCSTGAHPRDEELSTSLMEKLLLECESMGIRAITILGGEPFLREDLWRIYEKFREMIFQVYTNGTLITREAADRLAELGNILLLVSVDGPEPETDSRRGRGTFRRIMAAMENLRAAGAIFGFSATITRQNLERIVSDEFNDMLIEKGCLFGWHFHYMPVGRHPDPSLIPTPEQREYLRTNGAARIRAVKPLFVMDFLNDSPFVGGCIAAGRRYLHINARGDVEPCVYAHFATDNIKQKTLREVLRSPFFMGIRARQPYHPNLLRPCMLLDHPDVFRKLCSQYKAYPTHPEAGFLLDGLARPIDSYAAEIGRIMDEAWESEYVDEMNTSRR